MTVVRLATRSELWWPETVQSLGQAGRRVLLEAVPGIVAGLQRLSFDYVVLPGEILPGDVLIVAMSPVEELVLLTDRLLGPGGCPWDIEQTHESLKRYLLEETYEVLEAIDEQDSSQLCEELGDLMLQPILHAQKATDFDTDDVANGILDKLIRRHPHVFGDVEAHDAETVLRNWDRIKQTEKSEVPKSVLDGVPKAMPALLRAFEVSKRAARCGFEWPDVEAVWDKMGEEERELREAPSAAHREAELGDLLFTAVNLARWMNIEPEEALRKMLDRFTARFQAMETTSDRPLSELSPVAWDELWTRAKMAEGQG